MSITRKFVLKVTLKTTYHSSGGFNRLIFRIKLRVLVFKFRMTKSFIIKDQSEVPSLCSDLYKKLNEKEKKIKLSKSPCFMFLSLVRF